MDLGLGNGRTLHVYDTGTGDAGDRLAVFWHQGTPNIGAPPEPLFAAAEDLGIGCWDRAVPSSHGEWLAHGCPTAELRLYADEGHISVLEQGVVAMEWLRRQADRSRAS